MQKTIQYNYAPWGTIADNKYDTRGIASPIAISVPQIQQQNYVALDLGAVALIFRVLNARLFPPPPPMIPEDIMMNSS